VQKLLKDFYIFAQLFKLMSIIQQVNHKNIYFFGLVLLSIALPTSLFLMSISQFILMINWLWEANFRNKIQVLKNRKGVLLIISIFILHIVGLIYSTDLKYAINDIRIKLPLLILPLVIGTSENLDSKKLKILFLFLISSVTISAFISSAALFGLIDVEINDIRDISLFISHIRFALLVNMSIFSLWYFLFFDRSKISLFEKILYSIISIWLFVFLFLLQSLTGIAIVFILGTILFCVWISYRKLMFAKFFAVAIVVFLITFAGVYLRNCIVSFYEIEEIDTKKLEKRTANGNLYSHNYKSNQIENGNFVELYICNKELGKEWNQKSEYKFDGLDKKNQEIKYTLIRYLSSLGLRKDSTGISKLSKSDISMIENGYANHIFKNKFSIYPRIYQVIWEFDYYINGGNPSGHSVTQRLEYLKVGIVIIKNNFLIGVGTGDVQNSFDIQYEKSNSILQKKYRRRAHNQFVTFFIAFGLLGFLWIMFAIIYPIIIEKKYRNYFFLIFILIVLVSFLNEDTLETQAGITFFTFFYSLLMFGISEDYLLSKKN
jgi:hypothetical protein